ncbi:MAG TPA: hypothetical protein VMZ53_33375 [Kofleriaceae bacterium]|nr:hypothetical protein [Kofleriaceae bacterium]
MGLPACWTSHSRDPNPPPPPPPPHDDGYVAHVETVDTVDHRPQDPWQWQANPAAAAPQRCTPETVCGRSDTKHGPTGCGPTGDHLESFAGNYQKMTITKLSWAANPAELRPFTLDLAETASYQRTVTVSSGVDHYCCYSQCTPSRPASQLPVVPAGMQLVTNCSAAPAQVANPHADNADCPATLGRDPYVSGTNSQCCYGSIEPIPPPPPVRHYRGRAARVDGEVVMAPVRGGATWRADELRPTVADLSSDTRAALRDAWQLAAQMEHASIAAFSALSLRLMSLGAPADLIARTHEAALDEIRHTQIAFALASAYAAMPLEPACFDAAARVPTASTLSELARETFLDGCIEETSAAVDASLAANDARDPVIAAALRSIADDEARHAALAWSIVGWCVRAEPAIARDLRALLDELVPAVRVSAPDALDLAGHGIRSPADSARTRDAVLRDVVAPCLLALEQELAG